MRTTGLLLVAVGAAVAVTTLGHLTADRPLALRATAVVLLALTGYAALALRRHPGAEAQSAAVRWPLLAGLGVLAAEAVVAVVTYRPPALRPDFQPPPAPHPLVLGQLARSLVAFGPSVLAYCCLAAALLALPHRWRPRLATAFAGAGLVFVVVFVRDVAGRAEDPARHGNGLLLTVAEVVVSAGPPLLVAVAAFVMAGLGGQLARAAWPAAVGALLLAFAALSAADRAVWNAPPFWPSWHTGKAFLATGYLVTTATDPVTLARDAAEPVARLVGLTLVAVGGTAAARRALS
jgi:hypothetical protein